MSTTNGGRSCNERPCSCSFLRCTPAGRGRIGYGEPALDLNDIFMRTLQRLVDKASAGSAGCVLFKGCDSDGQLVAFAELTVTDAFNKLPGVPSAARRPLVSNFAVAASMRRKGTGQLLCRACEAAAQAWGFSELLLQVESTNQVARSFYDKQGFEVVAIDQNARRLDPSGFIFLKVVPTTKLTLRKVLTPVGPDDDPQTESP